jgi:serine/threonine protein kinase
VKLGDLGLARELNKGNNAETLVGTFSYMAPEIREESPYTYSADIWALGIIVFEVLTRKQFQYVNYMKTKSEYFKEFEDLKIYDPVYLSIIRGCLEIDPTNRLTIEQISDRLTVDESVEIRNFEQIEVSSSSNSVDLGQPQRKKMETSSKNQILKWTVADVIHWLDELNMQDYQMSFKLNEIDGEALLELKTNEEFTNYLKIEKLGHIKKLQKLIKEFNEKTE